MGPPTLTERPSKLRGGSRDHDHQPGVDRQADGDPRVSERHLHRTSPLDSAIAPFSSPEITCPAKYFPGSCVNGHGGNLGDGFLVHGICHTLNHAP